MAETISGTTNFSLPVDELLEMALESIGGEFVNYKEARMARTALNLLLLDLQNRGTAPLASLKETVVPLVAGVGTVTLSNNIANVMDGVIVTTDANGNQTDLPITKMSYDEWMALPNKDETGRPNRVLVDKQRGGVQLRFWPIPDDKQLYSYKTWGLNRIADVNGSYQLVDVPNSYLPAITMGLTYFMSIQRNLPIQERDWYKNEYGAMLDVAMGDDRERVDFTIYPAQLGQLRR